MKTSLVKAAGIGKEFARLKTGASFARGQSKQDYATPRIFLEAVEKRWGKLEFDIAATAQNTVAPAFWAPTLGIVGRLTRRGATPLAVDALKQTWSWRFRNAWLNPPFDTITPWAERCATWASPWMEARQRPVARDQRLFFLVPASVGSTWWANFVHEKAAVKFLSPRLSFDGKNPYPKDCALVVYNTPPGYECWRWDSGK